MPVTDSGLWIPYPVKEAAVAGAFLTDERGYPIEASTLLPDGLPVAARVDDGGDRAQGSTADNAATDTTSPWSVISVLKGLFGRFVAPVAASDALSNPTATGVLAYAHFFNSGNSQWRRLPSAALADGSSTGAFPVVLEAAISGTNIVDRLRVPVTFKTFNIAASSAETTIWTPAAGKKFRVQGFFLFSNTATVLTFKDGTGGTTIMLGGVAVNSQFQSSPMGNGILSAAANNLLTLTCASASTVNGTVYGTEE